MIVYKFYLFLHMYLLSVYKLYIFLHMYFFVYVLSVCHLGNLLRDRLSIYE